MSAPARRKVALAALAALPYVLAACDGDDTTRPGPDGKRANAVTGAPSTTSRPSTSTNPSANGATSASLPARTELCTSRPGSSAPKFEPQSVAAAGAPALPSKIAFGAGKWIWINVWAAWCVPCKDEIPMVRRFEADLRKAGISLDVAFVSIDDDEREISRFLAAQRDGDLRASYWLPDGPERKGLFSGLGIKSTTSLPIQAFYNPKGELACLVDGAIRASDYELLHKLMSAH